MQYVRYIQKQLPGHELKIPSMPPLRRQLQKQMKPGMIAGLKKIVDG